MQVTNPVPPQDALNNYMKVLEDSVKAGSDFAAEQLPLLAQEIINWYLWSSVFLAVCFFVIAGIFLCVTKGLYNTAEESGKAEDQGAVLISGAVVIVSLVNAMTHSYSAVYALVAPRLVILDKISELIS